MAEEVIESQPAAPGPFVIGLVLSGAVSAGSYAAGVLDYLVETLEDYEKHRERDAGDGPRHRVQIRAMSGSSSGGITAASLVGAFAGERKLNRLLYEDWVCRVDIDELLQTRDLETDNAPVQSLLDCTVIEQRLQKALQAPQRNQPLSFVADPLDIFITLANVPGIIYPVTGADSVGAYEMNLHSDFMHFCLCDSPCDGPDHTWLPPAGIEGMDPGWKQFYKCALATAAFPLAFPARKIERRASDYDERFPDFPPPKVPGKVDGQDSCRFPAVDGGLMKNTPVGLARNVLIKTTKLEKGKPENALWAVLLIDPLPYVPDQEFAHFIPGDNLAQIATSVIEALILEVRFQPEEISRAFDEQTCDSFIISPERSDGLDPVIFSAKLGSFAGFLRRAYREHDYQLGRRNCQRFLREHFALSYTNRIFQGWNGNYRGGSCLIEDNNGKWLPILPVNPAEPAIELPPRPNGTDWTFMKTMLDKRMTIIGNKVIDEHLSGTKWLLTRLAWSIFLRRSLRNATLRRIRQELGSLK